MLWGIDLDTLLPWSKYEVKGFFVLFFGFNRHPDVYKQQLTLWEAKCQA